MKLSSGVNLTTAIIDLLTGVVCIPLSILILNIKEGNNLKYKWSHILGALGVANIFGGIIHLYLFEELAKDILWCFLFPLLFELVIALFNLSLYKYKNFSKQTTKLLVVEYLLALVVNVYQTILGFYRISEIRVFAVFAAAFGVPALTLLIINGIRKKEKSVYMIFMVLILLSFGLFFQLTKKVNFKFIIDFDHNVIFHLCLFISVILMYFTAKIDANENYQL